MKRKISSSDPDPFKISVDLYHKSINAIANMYILIHVLQLTCKLKSFSKYFDSAYMCKFYDLLSTWKRFSTNICRLSLDLCYVPR